MGRPGELDAPLRSGRDLHVEDVRARAPRDGSPGLLVRPSRELPHPDAEERDRGRRGERQPGSSRPGSGGHRRDRGLAEGRPQLAAPLDVLRARLAGEVVHLEGLRLGLRELSRKEREAVSRSPLLGQSITFTITP